MYLSGLQLSTLCLSSNDLDRLPLPNAPLSDLIKSSTARLSIHLVGHPSTQLAKGPWHEEDEGSDDESDFEEQRDDWTTLVPIIEGPTNGKKTYNWYQEEHQLLVWRQRLNNKLAELAGWLQDIKAMEELSVEASSEYEGTMGPRWDYLMGQPMLSLISSLPVSLKSLTLDTCGSTIATSKHDRKPLHVCPQIAKRLHRIQNVRLRMRHICPEVLQPLQATSHSASRLESLVIRLSIPIPPPP